jgi:hypothetical protein
VRAESSGSGECLGDFGIVANVTRFGRVENVTHFGIVANGLEILE